MVQYICNICNKEFVRKKDLEYHQIHKKKPCEAIKIQIQKNPDESKKIQNLEIFNENIENIENTKNFSCNFCNKIFFNNSNLNKHLKNNSCKVKKLQDEEKENIFKILLAKDEELKTQKEFINKLDENNKELKEYIKNISNINLDLNNKVNKLIEKISIGNINKGVINNNNNNINNIIITTDQLCNFGSEDIKQIDTKLFSNINGKIGKHIFIECAKNIYNNLSKNKTLYFSDLSKDNGT